MLKKFEVSNFKNFQNNYKFDLSNTNSYEFNTDCVKNEVVNKSLVYGYNGVGKSNLGFAIFDFISHLTDKYQNKENYTNYLNAFNHNQELLAEFKYEFQLDDGLVCYEYGKSDFDTLIYEKLKINGAEYASIDRRESNVASINASGAENLQRDLGDSKISIVTYIKRNTVLEETVENRCFFEFIEFINGMLFFRSLDKNDYMGLQQGGKDIGTDIIENGHLEDFREFLNVAGINSKLVAIEGGEQVRLGVDFNGKVIQFFEIASQGARSLALFYYWLQRLRNKDNAVSFLFIDEFDAFYHHDLSAFIVKMLRDIQAQVIITTHNTSVMTNNLLRPDCYFLMKNDGIFSLASSTSKELREAHNIEKMYKAGSFSG